jgi:general secretion pathway protein G
MVDLFTATSNPTQEHPSAETPFSTCLNNHGFSLIELLVVTVILAVLASFAVPAYYKLLDRAKTSGCISELRTLEKEIVGFAAENRVYPNSLADLGLGLISDPWGNAYQYRNHANGDPPRLDMLGILPLNTDFDIFSLGKDGLSMPKISEAVSLDDVVRAGDGNWVGLGENF